MTKLKRVFLKGQMNKDLDERIVPNGEYRDALNIQVSTTDDSDIGTAQNILGNTRQDKDNYGQFFASGTGSNNNQLPANGEFTYNSSNALVVGSKVVEGDSDYSSKRIYYYVKNINSLETKVLTTDDLNFARKVGINADAILEFTQSADGKGTVTPVFTDVYEVRCRPLGNLPHQVDGQNGTINNVPTGVNLGTEQNPEYAPAGIKVGMEVQLLGANGLNAYQGYRPVVTSITTSINPDEAQVHYSGIPPGSPVFNLAGNTVFRFISPKVLMFDSPTTETELTNTPSNGQTQTSFTPTGLISAIDVVDNFLIWTDNKSEPRKINIDIFKSSTKSITYNTFIQRSLNNSYSENWTFGNEELLNAPEGSGIYPTVKHTSVIKRNPTSAPQIEVSNDVRVGGSQIPGTNQVYSNSFLGPVQQFDTSNNSISSLGFGGVELMALGTTFHIICSTENVNWIQGDIITLTGLSSGKKAKVTILTPLVQYINDGTGSVFKVSLTFLESTYDVGTNDELWSGTLTNEISIYENTFVSFAYRYKYTDGEYSCISPYSIPAFVPQVYNFSAENGVNESMLNNMTYIKVSEFNPADIPEDVTEVDIIIRDNSLLNLYVIKTISSQDDEFNLKPSTFNSKNKGYIELNSEAIGTTIETNQILRNFDNVPIKAKAQSIIASRLTYGNYEENYDLIPYESSSAPKIKGDIAASVNSSSAPVSSFNIQSSNNLLTVSSPQSSYTSWTNSGFFFGNMFPGATNQQVDISNKGDLLAIRPEDGNPDVGGDQFAGVYDAAGVNVDEGVDGNFQDFSVADQWAVANPAASYTTQLIPSILGSMQEYNNDSWMPDTKPYLYKVPVNGLYSMTASVWAQCFMQYFEPVHQAAATGGLLRQAPFRLVLNKYNNAGVYQSTVATGALCPNLSNSTFFIPTPSVADNYDDITPFENSTEIFDHLKVGPQDWRRAVLELENVALTEGDYVAIAFQVDKDYLQNGSVQLSSSSSSNNGNIVYPSNQNSFPNSAGGPTVALQGNGVNGTSHFRIAATTISGHSYTSGMKWEITNSPSEINTVTTPIPYPTVRSNRNYELGVVYGDYAGRESTVVVSKKGGITIPFTSNNLQNLLSANIKHQAPYWAKYYKFYVKENTYKSHNLAVHKIYDNNDGASLSYIWLTFNSNDIDKINEGDYILPVKKHGLHTASESARKYKVISISNSVPTGYDGSLIDNYADGALEASGADVNGKFFVKIRYNAELITQTCPDSVGNSDEFLEYFQNEDHTGNPTIFEVTPRADYNAINEGDDETKGFYWEVGSAYPIYLDTYYAEKYIKCGAKVEIIIEDNAPPFVATNQSNWNTEHSAYRVAKVKGANNYNESYDFGYGQIYGAENTCVVNLGNTSGDLLNFGANALTGLYTTEQVFASVNDDVSFNDLVKIRFTNNDGSFVEAYAMYADESSLYILPCTHPKTGPFSSNNNFNLQQCIPWFNSYGFSNGVESDQIGDTFNSATIFPYTAIGKQAGFKANGYLSSYGRKRKATDLIYSQLLNKDNNINGINQFILADKITKKLNKENGAITSLISRNNDLVALCENKCTRILSSGKNALFNADGNSQLVASSNVLGQAVPFDGDYGCQNAESVALDEYRIYFVDNNKGAVLRLSRDGLTTISDVGMKQWFYDNTRKAKVLTGSFDGRKDEYNITVHDVTALNDKKNVHTISYHEPTDGWVSFKSFIQEGGQTLNNYYYTFKNGKIWLHHDESGTPVYNNFYGLQYNSSITPLFNDMSEVIKSFKTLQYEGSQARVVQNTGDGEYYNISNVNGWYVEDLKTDQQEGVVDEFIDKENKWFNYIKGVATSHTNAADSTSNTTVTNLDYSEFSVQGVGALSANAVVLTDSDGDGSVDVIGQGNNLTINVTPVDVIAEDALTGQNLNWSASSFVSTNITSISAEDITITISPDDGYYIQASMFTDNITSISGTMGGVAILVADDIFSAEDVTFTDTNLGAVNNNVTMTISLSALAQADFTGDIIYNVIIDTQGIQAQTYYNALIGVMNNNTSVYSIVSASENVSISPVQGNEILGILNQFGIAPGYADFYFVDALINAGEEIMLFNLRVIVDNGYEFDSQLQLQLPQAGFGGPLLVGESFDAVFDEGGVNGNIQQVTVNYTSPGTENTSWAENQEAFFITPSTVDTSFNVNVALIFADGSVQNSIAQATEIGENITIPAAPQEGASFLITQMQGVPFNNFTIALADGTVLSEDDGYGLTGNGDTVGLIIPENNTFSQITTVLSLFTNLGNGVTPDLTITITQAALDQPIPASTIVKYIFENIEGDLVDEFVQVNDGDNISIPSGPNLMALEILYTFSNGLDAPYVPIDQVEAIDIDVFNNGNNSFVYGGESPTESTVNTGLVFSFLANNPVNGQQSSARTKQFTVTNPDDVSDTTTFTVTQAASYSPGSMQITKVIRQADATVSPTDNVFTTAHTYAEAGLDTNGIPANATILRTTPIGVLAEEQPGFNEALIVRGIPGNQAIHYAVKMSDGSQAPSASPIYIDVPEVGNTDNDINFISDISPMQQHTALTSITNLVAAGSNNVLEGGIDYDYWIRAVLSENNLYTVNNNPLGYGGGLGAFRYATIQFFHPNNNTGVPDVEHQIKQSPPRTIIFVDYGNIGNLSADTLTVLQPDDGTLYSQNIISAPINPSTSATALESKPDMTIREAEQGSVAFGEGLGNLIEVGDITLIEGTPDWVSSIQSMSAAPAANDNSVFSGLYSYNYQIQYQLYQGQGLNDLRAFVLYGGFHNGVPGNYDVALDDMTVDQLEEAYSNNYVDKKLFVQVGITESYIYIPPGSIRTGDNGNSSNLLTNNNDFEQFYPGGSLFQMEPGLNQGQGIEVISDNNPGVLVGYGHNSPSANSITIPIGVYGCDGFEVSVLDGIQGEVDFTDGTTFTEANGQVNVASTTMNTIGTIHQPGDVNSPYFPHGSVTFNLGQNTPQGGLTSGFLDGLGPFVGYGNVLQNFIIQGINPIENEQFGAQANDHVIRLIFVSSGAGTPYNAGVSVFASTFQG